MRICNSVQNQHKQSDPALQTFRFRENVLPTHSPEDSCFRSSLHINLVPALEFETLDALELLMVIAYKSCLICDGRGSD